MLKCVICGCSDFFKASGYSFCMICQTQSQDIGEELEYDLPMDNTMRLRKTKVYHAKRDRTERDEEVGWTSWELYNFVLIGLTNELIELGISADIKVTVLQLWARYLGKLEVAFVSTEKKLIPKLARRYKKRDAEILYGRIPQKRPQKRIRTESTADSTIIYPNEGISSRELNRNKKLMVTADYDRFIRSQVSSEEDTLSSAHSEQSFKHTRIKFNSSAKEEKNKIENMAKKRSKRSKYKQNHVTTQYKTSPELITPTKLWAILYLALRIHNQDMHLSDMIRCGREGRLSYYKLDHLIPPEVPLTKTNMNFLSRATDVTHKGMRKVIGQMAKFLGVTKIVCPDLYSLVNRYCIELALPKGISLYAERLISLSSPKMTFDKISCIPNYEGRAMAFIIVILKTLLSLDGITENEISNVAENINRYRQCENFNTPCILVHGDVGNFHDTIIIEKTVSCKNAASIGYQSLLDGANSVQAVEIALWWLECDEFFNCGYGSVLNNIGEVQMDASIVDGFKSECGSVAAISDIEHPISLARYVLANFPNSIVVGEGARKLTRYAKLNWLSKGNMTAPMAHLAYNKSREIGSSDINLDTEDHHGSTIGCIAYDGYAIAAGVTSGGLNKKLMGSVGDSSVLGCSTYADQNVGCSLTGHGESIMKHGLSRIIVGDIEEGCSLRKALKKNLDYMSTRYNQTFGGVVFEKSGEWDIYFTSHKMPYAVIINDCVTFGAALDEKNVEKYFEYREEPEIVIRKHLIPKELVYAMKQCITNASYIAPPLNEVNHFSPTLTPNHSYLQQLLEHPLYDLPGMLRNDFLFTKIGYLRKSKFIDKLISHYDIQIDSIDSNLHFIEKIVPVFEQTKIASIKDLKGEITIEDFMENDKKCVERKEDFIDYLLKEIPCQFKIDVKRKQYYDDTIIHMKAPLLASALTNEFIFHEILPDGKLSIPGRCLDGDESQDDNESKDDDACLQNIVSQQTVLSLSKFCKAYNINLSSTEKKAILINSSQPKKQKRKLVRNSFGKFAKQTDTSLNIEKKSPNKDDNYMEQTEIISTDISGIENILPEVSDILNLSANASIFDNFIKLENEYGMNDQSEKETRNKIKLESIIDESIMNKRLNSNILRLFKPFKDYWMYHCNFSRVKSKNFEILEKMLPRSFRWLLNECASNIEMSTEDLYEEVCLVEAYYAYVSEESKIYSCPTNKSENCNNQAYINAVLKKW
ncbi:L-asparaginase [Trachymyrmex cornetzi]|uniref:L-asparaginase n=1 Tax=Trachymyrmex cornetzi TaxID=471704 RepID=A0A151ITY8_9HYME|nr:L-asparaginase [Trachymyrmex cornetzi]